MSILQSNICYKSLYLIVQKMKIVAMWHGENSTDLGIILYLSFTSVFQIRHMLEKQGEEERAIL